jgi:hypothetical protein
MNLVSTVDAIFAEQAKFPIRIDAESKLASILDVIRMITGSASNDAKKTLTRIWPTLAAKNELKNIKINGLGRPTPVASAPTLVEIIWELPGKAAKDFRRSSAQYICRLLGADLKLAAEIEERHATTSSSMKEFFMPSSAQNADLSQPSRPEQHAIVVHKRPCIKVSGVEFEVPTEDDPPAIKQLLDDRLKQAMAFEFNDMKAACDAKSALLRREMENETEGRMVITRKRSLQEFAIENCELVAKRTKAVFALLTTLKSCDLIHPSLITAAIGSISNMAAEAAGVGAANPVNDEPSHLEDFSAMTHKMCGKVLDMRHLGAIGKLVATEHRNLYGGKNPERVMKQVNGSMRAINVYETKDREWIESIVRDYVAGVANQ